MVTGLFGLLPDRDASIIRRRHDWIDGEPQTLDDMGQTFDLTRERIRKIVKNSIALLRINLDVWAQTRSQGSAQL